MRALPAHPQRILLVNPTRYLGNLLIAGGLMQDYVEHCSTRGIELRIVVDEMYAELLAGAFNPELLILYPRRSIANAGLLEKVRLYRRCVQTIRRFKADLAFNIEIDSVAQHLTLLSGASFKLGCNQDSQGWGYDLVLPISFTARPEAIKHRWFSYQDVFTALGLAPGTPHYLRLNLSASSPALQLKLKNLGVDFTHRIAVLHTGATKQYKLWPHRNFATLASLLLDAGYQVVLMGAGKDATNIAATLGLLAPAQRATIINLCNQLSLAELASFLSQAALMVGNDSGPFHLAAALGVPGVVIFGPTDATLWGPIATNATLLQDRSVCSNDCSRNHCRHQYRCLPAITPEQVLLALKSKGSE